MKKEQIQLEQIYSKLRATKRDIKYAKERLLKDFNKEVSWVMNPLFKANQWDDTLGMLLEDNVADVNKMNDKIKVHINYLEDFLSQPSNVRRNSSCEITNMTLGWRFETNMEILKFLKTSQTNDTKVPIVKKVVETLASPKIREVRTRRRSIGDGSSNTVRPYSTREQSDDAINKNTLYN